MDSPCRIRRPSRCRVIPEFILCFARPLGWATLLCGGLLGGVAPAARAQELVVNGEFSFGSIGGWTLSSDGGYIGNNAGAGPAAWLTLYGSLRQDLPTTPGQAYLLRFRAKPGEPQLPVRASTLTVFWGDQRVAYFSFPTPGSGWTEPHFVLRAAAALTRLRFEAFLGPGLDVVSVVPLANVPLEPRLTHPTGSDEIVESQDLAVVIDPQPSDPGVTVSSARVFLGGVSLLGTASGDPLTFVWTNAPAGTFNLSAEVTSDSGFVAQTAPVQVTIEPRPKVLWHLPASRSLFLPGQAVELRAYVSDLHAVIRRVVFRANDEEVTRFTGWNAAGLLSWTWALPGTGNYRLTATGEAEDGTPIFEDARVVHVLPPGRIDQRQPVWSGTAYVLPTNAIAQVFTAGMSGRLRQVELHGGHNDGFETAPVTVSILDVVDGKPGTNMLGSTTLTFEEASIPGDQTYSSYFSFPSNDVRLVAGHRYAIEIRTQASYSSFFQAAIADVYPGGDVYAWSGTGWEPDYAFEDPRYPLDLVFTTVVLPDAPPQVSLEAPAPLASFEAGQAIPLRAGASDPDGPIDRVEFLADGRVIGTARTSPFTVTWTNVPAGNHILGATAFDEYGASATAEPVSVLVAVPASLPRLRVRDTYAPERNASLPPLVFEVTLSRTSSVPVSVDYRTSDGTAFHPIDYLESAGTLTFSPGETRAVVFVRLPADPYSEPNKRLFLNLWNPTNALIEDARAVGVIVDDDGGPDYLGGLQWQVPETNVTALRPFPVSLSGWGGEDRHAAELVGTIQISVKGPAAAPRLVLGDSPPSQSFDTFGGTTEGYAFRPSVDILVTHLRCYGGVKVSLWQEDRTLLADRVFPFSTSWGELPLDSPVILRAGERYRLAQYTGPHRLYNRTDGASQFQDGVIEWAYGGAGDSFPTETSPSRWPLVDLRYQVVSLEADRALPRSFTNFSGSRWTGDLVLHAVGEAIVLVATDDFGHTAESPPLRVSSPAGGFDPLVVANTGPLIGPDPQTGLFRQRWRIENLGFEAIPYFQASVSNLPARVTVYGARFGTNGLPAFAHRLPLAPGAGVDWTLEYFDPTRAGGFSPELLLSLQPLLEPQPAGERLAVHRAERLPDGEFLVEFDAPASRIVRVQYSPDLQQWFTADWTLVGDGRRVQWIDRGPPKTATDPAHEPQRFYRLLLAPL